MEGTQTAKKGTNYFLYSALQVSEAYAAVAQFAPELCICIFPK